MGHHETIGKSDEWYTPLYLFKALGCTFDMDVASPVDRTYCNVPAIEFITENSLSKEWKGFIWMNPPFGGRGNKEKWLDKFFMHNNGIALTPDRTSAPWWQKAVKKCDALLLVDGKIKFIRPDGSIPPHPGNGTTLFAVGKKAVDALYEAQRNKLGVVLKMYNQ